MSTSLSFEGGGRALLLPFVCAPFCGAPVGGLTCVEGGSVLTGAAASAGAADGVLGVAAFVDFFSRLGEGKLSEFSLAESLINSGAFAADS